MALFTSAAISAGTRARFSRITRLAAGGRGWLAVWITVTSTGSLASTTSQPCPCCGECCTTPSRRPTHLLQVGHLRNAQFLGALRADLGRVAVDGLPAAEDEIVPADRADRLAEDIAGRQGVAGGRPAIGQQDRPIGPSIEAFAQHVGRFRRSHADNGDSAAVTGPAISKAVSRA